MLVAVANPKTLSERALKWGAVSARKRYQSVLKSACMFDIIWFEQGSDRDLPMGRPTEIIKKGFH